MIPVQYVYEKVTVKILGMLKGPETSILQPRQSQSQSR